MGNGLQICNVSLTLTQATRTKLATFNAIQRGRFKNCKNWTFCYKQISIQPPSSGIETVYGVSEIPHVGFWALASSLSLYQKPLNKSFFFFFYRDIGFAGSIGS